MVEFKREEVQIKIKKCLRIIRMYDWLINSFVLDFYVERHWESLPLSWRINFENLQPEAFCELLTDTKVTTVWPLSILVLKKILQDLCISRKRLKEDDNKVQHPLLTHPKLKNIFTKCVKPKKRHEIAEMAKLCYENATKCETKFVIDFGAGLGHLARVISYGYGIKVCCLEMQEQLNEQASIIDQQLEYTSSKYLSTAEIVKYNRPSHITLKLTEDTRSEDFVKQIKVALKIEENSEQFSFSIIGLHPCGDLASILLKLFLECYEARFINLVGCCYMKLTTDPCCKHTGYPLSTFVSSLQEIEYQLSYESREIACHAIEMYNQRLRNGQYENLKVHSYRAAIEKILVKYWPELKHSGLRSIKHTDSLSFAEYSKQAVRNLNIVIPSADLENKTLEEDLQQWKRVVIFYTLRLMFAPLVESVILYDRILYLIENDCDVKIDAVFDPRISPRNHITTAIKRSNHAL